MKISALLNRDSGTLKTADLEALTISIERAFNAHGHTVEVRQLSGANLESELKKEAGREDIDTILVAGGDGTISSAARIVKASDKIFALLPAGTMNMFARSLQIPLDLNEAIEAVAGGEVRQIDTATVNGRTFLHLFSVGLHADVVRERENHGFRSRVGKIIASLRTILSVIFFPRVISIEISESGKPPRVMRTTAVSISNNPLGKGHMPYADRLDSGVLGLYIVTTTSVMRLLRVTFDVGVGWWEDNPAVEESRASSLVLQKRKGKVLHASVDGEHLKFQGPVTLTCEPGSLKILAPRPVQLDLG